MPFNHYAKIKRILNDQPSGWFIKRIDQLTSAKNFKGETVIYSHYYRIYNNEGEPIKYCKFQQIILLSKTLDLPIEVLPIIE